MSVQETTYIVLGVRLPFDYFSEEEREALYGGKYTDNVHKRDIGNHNGITVILDGKNGEYCVIGKVLVKARHTEGDGVSFTTLDISDSARDDVKQKLGDIFSITLTPIHPLVFTHYS